MKIYSEDELLRAMIIANECGGEFEPALILELLNPIEFPDYQMMCIRVDQLGMIDFGQRSAFGAGAEYIKEQITQKQTKR